MNEIVLTRVEGRLAILTLNRPEKRNALNDEMIHALQIAFEEAGANDDVKLIQLRAAGKAFSAGADLEYLQRLQANSYEENLADSRYLMKLLLTIYTSAKPVVAVVQGPALAGGCGLVTVCDFAIASTEAEFGYPEVRIGFVPALVMIFLVKRVGEGTARRLFLTGDSIGANEARQAGLITTVAEAGLLEDEVARLTAHLLSSTSSQSVRRIKKMLGEITGLSLPDALNYAAIQNAEARSTEDCKRGIESFLKKVKLEW